MAGTGNDPHGFGTMFPPRDHRPLGSSRALAATAYDPLRSGRFFFAENYDRRRSESARAAFDYDRLDSGGALPGENYEPLGFGDRLAVHSRRLFTEGMEVVRSKNPDGDVAPPVQHRALLRLCGDISSPLIEDHQRSAIETQATQVTVELVEAQRARIGATGAPNL